MEKYSVVIAGGGPAGICAAISARRKGEEVVICEKMPLLGKKILATGNGRCNLINESLDSSYYNPAARDLVESVLTRFGKEQTVRFFQSLGLEMYSKMGRIFPVTNQASSVLKVLEMELARLAIPVEYNFDFSGLAFSKSGISVFSKSGKTIECRRIVLAGGGMAVPAVGADGSMYEIVRKLGHNIVTPVPAAVPLVVANKVCHLLQGQRISAGARSVVDGKPGKVFEGELLFTKYGLSGTCILDISRDISVALNRENRRGTFVVLDLVPFMNRDTLKRELGYRLKKRPAPEEVLVGILPNKLCTAFKHLFESGNPGNAADILKDIRFKVSATRGWNEAEYSAGGVDVNEIEPATLESKIKSKVYFAGEILDVDGQRGGYNLGWAWASGFIAGLAD